MRQNGRWENDLNNLADLAAPASVAAQKDNTKLGHVGYKICDQVLVLFPEYFFSAWSPQKNKEIQKGSRLSQECYQSRTGLDQELWKSELWTT